MPFPEWKNVRERLLSRFTGRVPPRSSATGAANPTRKRFDAKMLLFKPANLLEFSIQPIPSKPRNDPQCIAPGARANLIHPATAPARGAEIRTRYGKCRTKRGWGRQSPGGIQCLDSLPAQNATDSCKRSSPRFPRPGSWRESRDVSDVAAGAEQSAPPPLVGGQTRESRYLRAGGRETVR